MNSTIDSQLYGYTGRLLRVDLTEVKVSAAIEARSDEVDPWLKVD